MQTERLLLRHFTVDDAKAYWPLVSDPAILKFTGESPVQSLEEVQQILLNRPILDYATYGFGRMACIDMSNNQLIGFCGFKYLPELDEVDIGYRFLQTYWGKGLATESTRALMQDAKQSQLHKRIIGLAMPQNLPSINVLLKLGMAFEKKIMLQGLKTAVNLYAMDC